MDKSLVHCHRGCEFEPRHSTILFFLILFFLSIISCAVACDFQQCGILTCVDSDEPVQPPFKLRYKCSQNALLAVAKYS